MEGARAAVIGRCKTVLCPTDVDIIQVLKDSSLGQFSCTYHVFIPSRMMIPSALTFVAILTIYNFTTSECLALNARFHLLISYFLLILFLTVVFFPSSPPPPPPPTRKSFERTWN